MGMSWTAGVKGRGQLSIQAGPSISGNWASVFRDSLREFNALSRRHRLGVTLAPAGAAAVAGGGPDVTVASAAGQISYAYEGTRQSESFDGSTLHGKTILLSRDGGIEKAFIFLPSQPLVNTPQGRRPVGMGVMKVIAVHELVHACGLHNSDHSRDDLFQGFPQVDIGDAPAGDRVRIEAGGRMSGMPPLVLSGSTVQKIRRLWAR